MFGALFRRLHATIDGVIGQLVSRAITALPFLAALVFAIVSLYLWLNRTLGPELGSLVLAAIFAVIGAIIAVATSSPVVAPEKNEPAVPVTALGEAASPGDLVGLSPEDRKLLMAAASTIAPAVIPGLGKALMRNLPLLAAIAAALFVLTRPDEEKGTEQPAE